MKIKDIINNCNSYNDLHNIFSKQTKKVKGDLFEEFCTLIFKFHPFYKNITKNAYLLKDVPKTILNKLNLPNNDIGIDVIVETNDDKYIAIQVKFRNNRYENIPYKELSTFIGTSFGIANNINLAYYFSNTYPINKQVTKSKVIPISGNFFDTLPDNLFIDIKNFLKNSTIPRKFIIPRPYQYNIINKSIIQPFICYFFHILN